MFNLTILVFVGVLTGFINVFAGGGSLISYPLLILLGLPVPVANGTNKLGLVFGGVSGAGNFIKKGEINPKEVLPLVPISLVGVFIGSKLSINMDDKVYTTILSVVMVLVLVVILFKPQRFLKVGEKGTNKKALLAAFTFIGFYAGFIQIGMGYLVITALSLTTGYNLLKITALKVFVAGFIFVTSSAVIFIYYGKVNFQYGIALGLGNALGAFIASNLAIKNGDKIFKPILIVSVAAMSIKLSGVYKFFT